MDVAKPSVVPVNWITISNLEYIHNSTILIQLQVANDKWQVMQLIIPIYHRTWVFRESLVGKYDLYPRCGRDICFLRFSLGYSIIGLTFLTKRKSKQGYTVYRYAMSQEEESI